MAVWTFLPSNNHYNQFEVIIRSSFVILSTGSDSGPPTPGYCEGTEWRLRASQIKSPGTSTSCAAGRSVAAVAGSQIILNILRQLGTGVKVSTEFTIFVAPFCSQPIETLLL